MVGITGTNYKPLEHEQFIRKALREMCALFNQYPSLFEKAFLLLVLISYIEPFTLLKTYLRMQKIRNLDHYQIRKRTQEEN